MKYYQDFQLKEKTGHSISWSVLSMSNPSDLNNRNNGINVGRKIWLVIMYITFTEYIEHL